MNKYIINFLIALNLFAGFLMCFTWGIKSYWIIYLTTIGFAGYSLIKRSIEKRDIICIAILEIFNIVITINYVFFENIAFNRSWFVQASIIPLLLISVRAIQRQGSEFLQKAAQYYLYFLCIPTTLFAFFFNIYVYEGLPNLFTGGLMMEQTYHFVLPSFKTLGIMKCVFPWFMTILAIISRGKRYYIWGYIIFYTTITGTKTVQIAMFGLLFLALILYANSQKKRLLILLSGITGSLAVVIYKFKLINDICLYDGRYFAPIFTSKGFWTRPLGIGLGNYYQAMLDGLYGVNSFKQFATSWKHTEMTSPHNMFPISESDFLLLPVCFGYLAMAIILAIIIKKIFSSIMDMNIKKHPERLMALYLLVFLLCNSVFQDTFNIQVSWFFYTIAFCFLSPPPLNKAQNEEPNNKNNTKSKSQELQLES